MKRSNPHPFLRFSYPLLSCVIIFVHALSAGDSATTVRPKIGLALSGGGARGAAHIGVLKVLKALHIPIDYVAGTSAGAVIGGLFASGMPVEEIEKQITNVDWQDIFNGRPSRQYRSFRRKEEDGEHLMNFEFGFNDGKFRLPRGLIAGQKLSFLLKSYMLPVADVQNFDQLPIPFRAVATDIITGKPVILGRGNLAEAIRASMSVPGAFSPVELDGRLLADGGIVENLPVDVLRSMGADIVIAVDIGTPLGDPQSLNSVVSISMQIVNILMQVNVDQETALLGDSDFLIQPSLGDIRSSDFPRAAETVMIGAAAARAQETRLRKYSVSSAEYDHFLTRQKTRRSAEIKIDYIKLGKDLESDRRVLQRLETRLGEKLDLEKLNDDLNNIYALGDFEQVDFNIVEDGNTHGLLIDAKRKSWGPNYLRFGMTLTSNLAGESSFTMIANYNMTRLNALGAEWKHQIQIGNDPRYFTEFYQPLVYSGFFFVAPQFTLDRFSVDVFDNQNRIAEYQVSRITGEMDAGMTFGNRMQFRSGLLRGRAHSTPSIGLSGLPNLTVDFAGFRERLAFDNLDNPFFPHTGWAGRTEVYVSRRNLGADSAYQFINARLQKLFGFDRHTVSAYVQAGTNFKSTLPFYDAFRLGGLFTLSGYRPGQIFGQKYALGRILYRYRFGDASSTFGTDIYVGVSFETGNAWNFARDIRWNNLKYSCTGFLGLDTLIGPIYFAYAQSRDHRIFYLDLGRAF